MRKSELYLPQPHHSASDWDIDSPHWELTTTRFVSPPSSIHYFSTGTEYHYQLCKHVSTLHLPQGRIVTQVYPLGSGNLILQFFRNIAAIGLANMLNCYETRLQGAVDSWFIVERVSGESNRFWQKVIPVVPVNEWSRYRTSWWLTWDILQCRLEKFIADAWVQQGEDITISDPLYADSEIQRPGIGCRTTAAQQSCYFDDTEISEYP